MLLKLGRKEPAEWAWETLLEENPDCYDYIKAYVRAKGADVGECFRLRNPVRDILLTLHYVRRLHNRGGESLCYQGSGKFGREIPKITRCETDRA